MILEDKTNLKARFDAAFQLMHRREFIENRMLGGEIPFFLMDYPIELHNEMEIEIPAFNNRLKAEGVHTLVIDLYDLSIEVINQYSSIELIKRIEQKKDLKRVLKALQSTLDVKERLIPLILEKIKAVKPQIILIKGIANIFPFLRANEILNHLNTDLSDIPTLVFYPGTYINKQLTLFNRIEDSRYYRAHPISELKNIAK